MNPIIPLNLPRTDLQLSRKDDEVSVLCLIRKKRIRLTPEEWVRQHFISFLSKEKGYPLSRIGVEKSIQYAGLKKRWDIIVYDNDFNPYILVECKAPQIKISIDTLYQALTYQKEMQGKIIALTNGLSHTYFEVDTALQHLSLIEEIPLKN